MKNDPTETKPTPAAEAATTASPTPARRKPATPKSPKIQTPSARPGTKKALILARLQRPNGATLQELTKATDWQPHSVRGFLSTLSKQMGVKLKVIDREGQRAYQVKS